MSKSLQSRVWVYISIVLAAILIIYIAVNPPGKQAEAADTSSVASVNGVNISKDKLYDALIAAGGASTLETMISNELVRQAADEAGLSITDEDLDKELDAVRANFSTEEEFLSTLEMYGMTLDGLKKDMETQAQLRKLLEPQVTITDEDIQKYYDENLETLKTPEQVGASHILVATKAEAETILAGLKNGDEFATIAQEKSTDTTTKENGGALELFSKGEKEEAIEKAVFALEVGQLSGVVEASDGFHIYMLNEHIDEVTPTLEEKKDLITETLTTDQISTLSQTWMEEQMAGATIVNSLEG